MLPGFIATEGFPQSELTAKPWTRWIVSTPERAAEAIYQAGLGRARALRAAPLRLAAALRVLAPGLVRRVLGGGAAAVMTTTPARTSQSARTATRRRAEPTGMAPGARE